MAFASSHKPQYLIVITSSSLPPGKREQPLKTNENNNGTKRTLPNTYIGSQSVSGKTKEQLEDLLTARIESLEKGSVIFEFEDNKLETDLKSLGVNFVKGASLQQAWSQRKSVNF